MLRLSTVVVALAFTFLTVTAETKVLQLSLTPDIALYDRDTVIEGLDLAIWGENEQRSLTLGFVNGSKKNSAGLSLGLINYGNNYKGVRIGLYNSGHHFVGYSGAMVNIYRGNFTGWADAIYNQVDMKMYGLQTGLVNYAKEMRGVQLGLINYTEMMQKGLQVGLINIVRNNPHYFSHFPEELAPAMVLVNWKF